MSNEILKALAFAASDEVRRYPNKPNLSDFYENSTRSTAAYESLTNVVGALEIPPDVHDQIVDMACELLESGQEEGFVNGWNFAMKLLRGN